jgi:four helix bundle protein
VTPAQLQERTFVFALQVYRYARPMLGRPDSRHIAQQLIRAATSVASNYRSACLARSPAEWVAKIGIVREESDEALFWLMFTQRADVAVADEGRLAALIDEADALTRIFAASYRTSRNRTREKVDGGASEAKPHPPQIDR